jgi:hypothetical protein
VAAANDTSLEAELVLLEAYRQMPIAEKWRRLGDLYQTARLLHEAGVRLRQPEATEHEVVVDWLRVTLEPNLFQQICKAMLSRARHEAAPQE